jgi:hypothetical protein
MEDNRWDDQLRDLLGEYKPGDTPSSPVHVPQASDPAVEAGDAILQDKSWKRIEASLDAADNAFDESMRRKIAHYHPPYDQSSWSVFLQRFADHQFLRTRLVMLKMIEVSALVLLLITAVKLGFVTNWHQSGKQQSTPATPGNFAEQVDPSTIQPNASNTENSADGSLAATDNAVAVSKNQATKPVVHNKQDNVFSGNSNTATSSRATITDNESLASAENKIASASTDDQPASNTIVEENSTTGSTQTSTSGNIFGQVETANDARATSSLPAIDFNSLETTGTSNSIGDITAAYNTYITDPISPLDSDIEFDNAITVPRPKYHKPKARKYTEFAILAQSDYNGLRMPEDKLFTYGQQIVFPQQGIMSQGFGGGFTIAIGHPRWAIETGVIYSAKNFQPGRQLIVGGVFDNGSINFEAMRLQLVSVPVQYRYRFDHTGRMKFYGLAGGGFNMIVQSDIDVQVEYHFPSLSFGANPNSDPNLADITSETRRISEHIRDGAPFSTKNFVSINAGAGVEYLLTEYKTLFMQGTVLYQIPDLEFSNNNGKHLRSVSLQVGVRTPLGK